MSEGKTPEGRDWKISDGRDHNSGIYPNDDTHTWGEFAGLAIELGGYNDITAIDPYTGRRFWLSGAFRCDAHNLALDTATPGDDALRVYQESAECGECSNGTSGSMIKAIRKLLDAMEAAGFLDVDPMPAPRA